MKEVFFFEKKKQKTFVNFLVSSWPRLGEIVTNLG